MYITYSLVITKSAYNPLVGFDGSQPRFSRETTTDSWPYHDARLSGLEVIFLQIGGPYANVQAWPFLQIIPQSEDVIVIPVTVPD